MKRKLKQMLTDLQMCNVFLQSLGDIHCLSLPFELDALFSDIFALVHSLDIEVGKEDTETRLECKMG